MKKYNRYSQRQLGMVVILLLLLTAVWPAAVQSQGSPPDIELLRFLQRRVDAPELYPCVGGFAMPTRTAPQSSHLPYYGLAFASYRDGNWEVYGARGDGFDPINLTKKTGVDSSPSLNHDATQIIFETWRDGNCEIYRMNADGTGLWQLTRTSLNEYKPVWSPSGDRIVYYGYVSTSNAEIYVMDADGNGQSRLTNDPAWDGHPTWSPDGSRIAFASNRGGVYRIWVMNADGSGLTYLPHDFSYAAYPSWSPDGNWIALSDDANGDYWLDLAIMSADGVTVTHPLPSESDCDYTAPTWSPDGQDLAVTKVHWVLQGGSWGWDSAYIYRYNLPMNSLFLLVSNGKDWWPDWESRDPWPPTVQMVPLPTWVGPAFPVQWSLGSDVGNSGIAFYEVQHREEGASWVDWLTATNNLPVTFTQGQDGYEYGFRCRAIDNAGNEGEYSVVSTTVDAAAPATAVFALPPNSPAPVFSVTWGGEDQTGSGIAHYDVQYRDGASGTWTDWLTQTTVTSTFFPGGIGHTYYFQSRAQDRVGNLEAYPGGDGDTHTQTPPYALQGYVLDTREQPAPFARITTTPPLSTSTALSDLEGSFLMYFYVPAAYALNVTHSRLDPAPPGMQGLELPTASTPTFYLPPLDDQIVDGGFESGGLASWTLSGAITPTLTTTAHTGGWAAVLGGEVRPPVALPAPPFTGSAQLTATGGLVASAFAVLEVPAGAVSDTVVFTVTGLPTVTELPTEAQPIGLYLAWEAALTDGTPFTTTLSPLTLTVSYSETAWQSAQVVEDTLQLWQFDDQLEEWRPLSGTLAVLSNTVSVTVSQPGVYALLGTLDPGPWKSILAQEIVLPPMPEEGTLSVLYNVSGSPDQGDVLTLYLRLPTTTLTYTLPLTTEVWVHQWEPVPPGVGPTVTVQMEWSQDRRNPQALVLLDEVTLGVLPDWAQVIYLPLVAK